MRDLRSKNQWTRIGTMKAAGGRTGTNSSQRESTNDEYFSYYR